MSKIDIDKFVEHLVKCGALDCNAVQSALFAQGLIFCNYKIQKIGENSPMQVEVERNQKSEDEKIREKIVRFIQMEVEDEIVGNKWLAWLEKQGEQKEPQVYETEDGEVITYSESEGHKVIEPKFKVGDWIVFNGWVLHIDEVADGYYRTTAIGGIPHNYDWTIDHATRLWTIQDAKPGDVLVTKEDERPFLFKGLDNRFPQLPVAYCGINVKNDFKICSLNSWWTDETVYPATEKQRAMLFSKMKEAGYEWDANKKELKEIEQKSTNWIEGEKIIYDAIKEVCNIEDSLDAIAFAKHNETVFDVAKRVLEKVGEQKVSVVDFKAKDWYVSKVDGKIHNMYHSVENPGPKFKIGDWVVNNVCLPIQIASIEDGMYIFTEGDAISISFIDEHYHLWSIEDAMDGDVLVTKEDKRPFIFKGLLDPNHPNGPVAYCGIDSEDLFHVSTGIHWWTDDEICPATKEQSDTLFMRMKEAGYEWDEEKKESKLLITNGGDFESENCEQEPAWSEEDERLWHSCIAHIEDELERIRNDKYGHSEIISDNKESCRERIKWLKSLKERMKGEQ